MSALENALSEQLNEQTSSMVENKNENAPNNVESINKGNSDAIASLEEQLVDIYQEVEYLTSKFPNHSIRSLTDLAISLQSKADSAGQEVDNGIVPAKLMAKLSTLTQEEADAFDIGIVEVDDNGSIKLYNTYESELVGVQKDHAIGKNFFTTIAPCTNNRLFLGAFKGGVQSNSLDKEFNYTFTYKVKPTPVTIHLYRDASSNRNYIFVKKR